MMLERNVRHGVVVPVKRVGAKQTIQKPARGKDGRIEVENILQNPELPTGCEATAGTMLLRAYGYETDKLDAARRLKKGKTAADGDRTYAGHPDEVFIGDPESAHSYGAFPKVLAEAMQRIIEEQGGQYEAKPLYGKTEPEILCLIDKGVPVCIWSSMSDHEIEYRKGWYLIRDGVYTDEYFTWPSNEHVLVLTGYDAERVFVCDPQRGECSYPRESFFRHYKQVGSYALTLQER